MSYPDEMLIIKKMQEKNKFPPAIFSTENPYAKLFWAARFVLIPSDAAQFIWKRNIVIPTA